MGSFNGLAKTPIASAPALRMGSIWHKGAEWWMEPTADDYPTELSPAYPNGVPFYVLMRAASRQQYSAIEAAVKEILGTDLDDEAKYKMSLEQDMLESMAMNYEGIWGSPLPDGFTAIKAEQTLLVDIPGTKHSVCDGCKYEYPHAQTRPLCNCTESVTWHTECHQLECTLDGLIQREDTGQLFILERKTYGNRPNREGLLKNDQYTAYMWAARQLGMEVYGAAYDGAWKRAKPANKTVQMQDLFLRLVITHSDAEIASYGKYLTAVAPEMAACYQTDMWAPINYPNPRWEGCWDCDLTNKEGNGVCDMMEDNNHSMVDFLFQTEYTQRATKGRELVWPGRLDTTVKAEAN